MIWIFMLILMLAIEAPGWLWFVWCLCIGLNWLLYIWVKRGDEDGKNC